MVTRESLLGGKISGKKQARKKVAYSTADIVCLLRKIKFLSEVDELLLQEIAKGALVRKLQANTALFHTGEPGHVLYMVVSGWVRIEKIMPSGQFLVIGKRGPGTQLGELALFDGSPRMADAVTETECELLSIERKSFLRCLANSSSASLAVMSSLAEMVRNAGASLENYRSLDTLGRLADLLHWYSEQLGVPNPSGGIKINLRLTHQSLAAHVGVQRETISRTLAQMSAVGAITTHYGTIVVTDSMKLQQMITGSLKKA